MTVCRMCIAKFHRNYDVEIGRQRWQGRQQDVFVPHTFNQSWQGDHCRSPVHPLLSYSMEMLCAMNDQILTMREVATYLKLAEKTA